MQFTVLIPVLMSLILNPVSVRRAATVDTNGRAHELAALFNKSKHKVKDRRGIHLEIHIDITSEPVVKPAAQYSGTYGANDSFSLYLEVSADGNVTGRGTEPGGNSDERSFTLRDTKVDGALVLGTKVYDNGSTEKFEGVFIRRTVKSNMQDRNQSFFGLGVVYDPPKRGGDDGYDINKLFYEAR